jgi:hypothetical protein
MNRRINARKRPGKAIAVSLAAVMFLMIGLAIDGFGQTAHTKKSKKQAASTDADVAAQSASQHAAVDPQTGRLREPTSDEAQKLAEEMNKKLRRSPEKLTVTQQSNGTEMVQLSEEYMEVMVVKLNADGSLSTECVTGMEAANKFLKADPKLSTTHTDAAHPAAVAKTAKAATAKGSAGKAATSRKSKVANRSTSAAGRKE